MENNKRWYEKTGWIVVLIVLFFPVGLFLMWSYAKWNKTVKWIITAPFAVLLIINLIRQSQETQKQPIPAIQQKMVDVLDNQKQKNVDTKPKVNYKIVYTLTTVRYDGGKNFYVLIDPVDLESDKFKDDIKTIITEIVSKNSGKISIDILDDKDILELYYKSHYASNQLGRILTKSELDNLAIHLMAGFSGELDTMLYKNQLDFFPGASSDNSKIGKYMETVEFNP